jgi:hypothetical protein
MAVPEETQLLVSVVQRMLMLAGAAVADEELDNTMVNLAGLLEL